MNYKIRVTPETSEEVQELFFELDYKWNTTGMTPSFMDKPFLFAENGRIKFGKNEFDFNSTTNKEITLPELRDLVVLKRNDVNDATHVGRNGSIFYHGFKDYSFNDGSWVESKLDNNSKFFLNPVIQEPQMTWEDALRAVADGEEVEMKNRNDEWESIDEFQFRRIRNNESKFRIKPKTVTLEARPYTKEELLKIAGEME